jgi:transcriptional regulator with XRE-family HTH domain
VVTSELSTRSAGSTFGRVLRTWRRKRAMSQLDLALASEVSQRHISFLESGRSQPSRDMVLRLATVLDVPLREQNVLLAAAGYTQLYKARELTDPELQQIRKALECMLQQQEPYPAMVVDRHWHMHMGNVASRRLLMWLVDPQKMQCFCTPDGHLNLLRLLFHPDGLRPYIGNWYDVAGHLIERLHREAATDGQSDTTMTLLNEILAYPEVPHAWHLPNWEAWQAPVLTLDLAKGGLALRFFSTITTLGTPHDITLQDLRLECFFPADEATEQNIKALPNLAP